MSAFLATVMAVLLFNSYPPAFAQDIRPKVIYGEDNRKEVFEEENELLRQLSSSTVALFNRADIKQNSSSNSTDLIGTKFWKFYNLCEEEPFRNQISGAFCSGSLIAEDRILTAGHCIRDIDECKDTVFVFGFEYRQKGANPLTVPSQDVVGCKRIISRSENDEGVDFAIIEIDRRITKFKPLEMNRKGIEKSAPLAVIGHPSGLPLKIAAGAGVRSITDKGYFQANLDTYGGNSGSAVFNAKTGLIEGVLVRGETDFVKKGNCQVSNRCEDSGCSGEDVTDIAEVLKHL